MGAQVGPGAIISPREIEPSKFMPIWALVLRWMRAKCLILEVRVSVTLWRVDWLRDIVQLIFSAGYLSSNITQLMESKDYISDNWHPHLCSAFSSGVMHSGFYVVLYSTDELSQLYLCCPLQDIVSL